MNQNGLKILYVITHMPAPAEFGVHHRLLNIGLALKRQVSLTVIYVGPECEEHRVQATRNEFGDLICFYVNGSEKNTGFHRIINKIKYHSRFYFGPKATREQNRQFAQLASENDLVWYHTIKAANYFRWRPAHSIMDLDDLNHLKFEYKHQTLKGIRARFGNKLLIEKWKRREFGVVKDHDLVLVCSREDKHFLAAENMFVLPNTFRSSEKYYPDHQANTFRIGFLGLLDYRPNLEGINWFIDEIWPIVLRECPSAKLRIAGRGSENLKIKDHNIEVLGFVEDLDAEINSWAGMIVPLTYGGGTRIKILEAFSKKCPVVSTQIGAYGLKAQHGVHALIADQPSVFAQCCIDMMNNPQLRIELANNALELYKKNFSEQKLDSYITEILSKTVSQNR